MKKIFTAFIMMLCVACVASAANYLTFTAEEDGSTFGIVNYEGNNPDVQYTLDDGETWTALAAGDTITLAHKGDKALLKGNNPEGFSKYWDQYSCFRMTGKVAANGSVMSLIDGLGLSTEIPGEFCFRNLFSDCTSLTQAPELPATTLTGNCYESMFSGCTSLTQAPALPATTLTEKCYDRMFSGCASLTRAPELPATTLAEACYEGMFQECTSLTQAPALPATTLPTVSNVKGGCYIFMFSGCTSLSRIRVSFDDWNDGLHTLAWVADVAPTGTFICPKDLPLEYGVDRIPEGWTVKYIDDTVAVEANYLTFTAEEDGSTFGIVNNEGNNPDVQYSLDGGETWNALAAGDTVTLAHKGDKALVRGNNPEGFSKGNSKYSSFTMTGKIAASGSVMSLIDGVGLSTEIPKSYCFWQMFENCTSLTQSPELPATNLAIGCYYEMFSGCTGLTQAPELPATTLARYCYEGMFSGCTSLAQAPALPATSLAGGCYYKMFSGCTSLSEINVSFTSWLETEEWVKNVAPTGTFICPKALALEYGEDRIPEGWTVKYIDDTVAAETNYLTFTAEEDGSSFRIVNKDKKPDVQYSLDGGKTWTALAVGDTVILAHKGDKALLRGNNPNGLLYSTFEMAGKVAASGSVMSLIDGTGLSTEIPWDYCFSGLFYYCTSLTQAPELPATTLSDYCYFQMFSGCKSLTQAPELPATTLVDNCYQDMFYNCTNLSEINVSFVNWSDAKYCTALWTQNVAPTGTFICPKTLPLEYGVNRIPEGWTVKYIDDTVAAETNYLTITAEEDGSSVGLVNNGSDNPDVQYSLDGGATWIALAEGDTVILAHKGDKALLKGNNPEGFSKSWEQYSTFKMTGKVAASGSVMSLIDGVGLSTKIPSDFCFYELFYNCTSLTQAPELPATTLTDWCYQGMFGGCTSLTQAPELPATTLPTGSDMEGGCYRVMFYGCTSLTQAPELPATTLSDNCYFRMFYGCTKLSEIHVSFDDWDYYWATVEWVKDVAPTGTFICPKALALEYGDSRIPEGWTVKYIDDTAAVETNYLTFTAEEDGSSFGIAYNYLSPDVQYSLNGGETWTELAVGDTILLAKKGDKALLRGYNEGGLGSNGKDNVHFIMTGAIAASGSVMSLIDGIGLSLKIPKESCFWYLFENCTSLTQAPEVPATTLSEWCYYGMFSGCTSLTQAPELPATTLADWCYRAMFEGCTGLIQVPELPATTLARSCYEGMFSGCTSLAQAPALPATTLVSSCYEGMFSGCTSLAQASALPATNLAPSCYCEMFSGCTSLTQAPALSAMKLVFECYSSMFSGCTSLTQAPELPATTLADDCYSRMFWGCTSLAQAPELPATTMAIHCYEYMFYGCTSLTKAPELPATELPDSLFMRRGCCESMFSGCTNLSEISIAFDKWNDNTFEWVKDVAPTGTFYCPKALPLEYGLDRIPEGWTVKYIEGEGSGVNTTLANNITIWTDGLTIYIRGAEGEVSLYDMSGKRVAVSVSADGERALSVPAKGVYVVRTNGGEMSVLVR